MHLLHQPAIYFILSILLMLGLDYYTPIAPVLLGKARAMGTFFFAAGGLWAAFAVGQLRKADTPIDPHASPKALVTTGPFAYSRNPIYLGLVLVLTAFAFRLGSLSPFLLIPFYIWIIDSRFIRAEEARLQQHFGADFSAYKQKVRRWL